MKAKRKQHGRILRIEVIPLLLFMALPWLAYYGVEVPDCAEDAGIELSEKIWNFNLGIVMDNMDIERRKTAIHEFSPSVLFFERVTGIESGTMTFVGRLPTPDLLETIEKWEGWFQDNRDRPDFHGRICRAFKNIQVEEGNLKMGYAHVSLIMELWVYSSNEWRGIISHTSTGKVTIPIKAIALSAKGEFAFVECFVNIVSRDSFLFFEVRREPRLSVYLGSWKWQAGRIAVRYRLYHSEPEIAGRSFPGPELGESMLWTGDKVRFRGLDFLPSRDIPMSDLHVRVISFVGGIRQDTGFYFRD